MSETVGPNPGDQQIFMTKGENPQLRMYEFTNQVKANGELKRDYIDNPYTREETLQGVENLMNNMAGTGDGAIKPIEAPAPTEPAVELDNPWATLRSAKERVDAEEKKLRGDHAKWTTRMRTYGAGQDVLDKMKDPEYTPTKEEIEVLNNYDLNKQLDEREGSEPITEDDINYWRLQEKNKAGEADPTVVGPEAPVEQDPTSQVPAELLTDPQYMRRERALMRTRTRYLELTSKQRRTNGIFGKKALAQAKLEYDEARNDAGGYVANRLIKAGATPEQISTYSHSGAVMEIHTRERELLGIRLNMADGKRLKGFYDAWARWGSAEMFSKAGLVGNAKKMATMALIGMPLGVAAGALGAVFLGPIAGGLAAVGAARGVARGLAGGRINKNANDSRTVALGQANANIERGEAALGSVDEMTHNFSSEDLTAGVERATKQEVDRNRVRNLASYIIGAASGTAGALIASHFSPFGGGGNHPKVGPHPGPDVPPTTPNVPHLPPATPNVPPAGPGLPRLEATDMRAPWTHMTERIGSNGTPRTMEIINHAQGEGWQFVGNNQGGGNGAFIEVIAPDGQHFTNNGEFNAILDMLDSRYA